MSTPYIVDTIEVMTARDPNGIIGKYLFDGDDVADCYTYRENEHGQKVELLPFCGAEVKAPLLAAAYNSYLALARRLLPDAMPEQVADCARRLAEADVLGLLYENYEHFNTANTVLDLMDSRLRIQSTIDQCRQTKENADGNA